MEQEECEAMEVVNVLYDLLLAAGTSPSQRAPHLWKLTPTSPRLASSLELGPGRGRTRDVFKYISLSGGIFSVTSIARD